VAERVTSARDWLKKEHGLSSHTTPFPGLLSGFGLERGELALAALFFFTSFSSGFSLQAKRYA